MNVKSIFIAVLLTCFVTGFNLAQNVDCSGVNEWQTNGFYSSGKQVVRFGYCYESKWNNSSTKPETNNGEWSVWTFMGKCDDYKSKIEFVKPKESEIVDVSSSQQVDFNLFVEDDLNITSMYVMLRDSKVKLTLNAGLWSGSWKPQENGPVVVRVEAKDASGNLFTAEINIVVKGLIKEEIILTFFFPSDGGVYEPNKTLYFQVEAYDKNFTRDVLSVHFEIDYTVKEAVYDAQLNRWGANISLPSAQGEYKVKAIGKDNSGNKEVKEITIKVKEKIDNKPPKAFFIQPKDWELIVPDAAGFFRIKFKAWDPDGDLKSVVLNIDNQEKIEFPSAADSLYFWDWSVTSSGWHQLSLEVEDNSGNKEVKEITIKVKEKIDNKPPKAFFIQPKDWELIVPDAAGFFRIKFKAWDPDGDLKSVVLNIDNQEKIEFPSAADSLYFWDWSVTTSGWHQLSLEVEDNLGEIKKFEIWIVVLQREPCYYRWNAFRTYYAGEIVSYNGNNYRAKWWNYQANPEFYSGSWDCWELMGPCIRGNEGSQPQESLHAKEENNLVLFPNPVEDVLHFSGIYEENVEVEIRDALGNLMIKRMMKTKNNTIQVTGLSAGTYLVSFKINSEVIRKSFVKK